jgi:putative peptidoglycan lipid II flippase
MNDQLFKKTSILAFITLISRILGFIRDIVIAQMFGITATVDAFFAANKVLSSLRGFLEGPLSQIFVPVLSKYRKKHSHAEEKHLFATTAGTLGFFVLVIVCLGIILVPYVLKLAVPGLEPYRFDLASYFLRLTFPYLLFISFCGLGVAAMNTYDKLWGVALTPIWLSISLITAAIFFSHHFTIPITALAWGVLFGGILQILFVVSFLKRLDLLAWPRINFYDPGVRRVIQLLLPAVLGASASQVGMLINTNLASFLPIGTISWIYYADRLVYFPLSVIGISLSTALLKPLSQYHVEGNTQAFNRTLGWGLRANVLIALPSSIAMGMLAGPFIVTLLMRGAFNANDVMQTKKALMGYVLGVPAFMLAKMLITAFYAQEDTRTPIKVVTLGALTNITIGMLLIPKFNQAGITLASSVCGWVQVLLMFLWLRRPLSSLFNPLQGVTRWILSLLCMSSMLIAFFYFTSPPLEYWLQWEQTQRFIRLILLGLGTVGIVGTFASYNGDFKQPLENR